MATIIHVLLLLPFLGFLLILATTSQKERVISRIAYTTMGVGLILSLSFVLYWVIKGAIPFNLRDLHLYDADSYHFLIDFFFDRVSATFLVVGSLISFLVVVFSRYYLHRDSGFKRYFNTVFFFYIGYLIVILSGNFETLFIGWEILGLSSFLLIGYYRKRYLPVKNALKVFTIYRIGDVGILLAMWKSHHLWHNNVTFIELHNYDMVSEQLAHHSTMGLFISLVILMAAIVKSAQFPFSSWLPRAMEGPTPSSAIFYGSLSVHIGAFLLMRTHPFWEHQSMVRWIIGGFGITTAVVSSMIASVQSTIKGQIAYSSSAQIGIIFLEIALGLELLALFHFMGNAFLRTYQLLVSPSVVSYLVREQFYNYQPDRKSKSFSSLMERLNKAAYLLAVKEWNLDLIIFKVILRPIKALKTVLSFIKLPTLVWVFVPLYIVGFAAAYFDFSFFRPIHGFLSLAFAILSLLMVSKAYNERFSSRLAWLLVVFSHFFIDLSISFNDHLNVKETGIYLNGIFISAVVGYFSLQKIRTVERRRIGLNKYHGLIVRHKRLAFLFLLACLGVSGFPITTTFLGEDLILGHIRSEQIILAFIVALTFIVNGIATLRIYSRIFLGHVSRNYQNYTDLTI